MNEPDMNRGNVGVGPETGKEGIGVDVRGIGKETIHTDAKEPKWADTQGTVNAGPATGVEGNGHPDAKAVGKPIIHTGR